MSPEELDFDERLDQAIERTITGETPLPTDADPAMESYERLAAELSRTFTEESPRLSPAVQSRQLAALSMLSRSPQRARRSWNWGTFVRWAQVAAIAIVVVVLVNGLTIASANTLPGSPLYPFKRLAEQSNLFFTPSADQRARAWMSLANVRLDEAQRLVASGQSVDPEILGAIEASLRNALRETTDASGSERLILLEQITDLAVRQQNVLDALAGRAAPADRKRLEQAARDLDDVATLAGEAQATPSSSTATPTLTVMPSATPLASPTTLLAPSAFVPAPTPLFDMPQTATPTATTRPPGVNSPTAQPPESEHNDHETAEPEHTPVQPSATHAPTRERERATETPEPHEGDDHHDDHPSATPQHDRTPTESHDD